MKRIALLAAALATLCMISACGSGPSQPTPRGVKVGKPEGIVILKDGRVVDQWLWAACDDEWTGDADA
mgnify:CR=1 FL=1